MAATQPQALATGEAVRAAVRAGTWTGPTSGLAPGHVQTNLVVLPAAFTSEFQTFCRANPVACPLLEVTSPGDPRPRWAAPAADLRSDLPRYWRFEGGRHVEALDDVRRWWTEDSVGHLIGCSFSFEAALRDAGVPLRHVEQGRNVPMYRTTVACRPSGPFSAPLVVTMRPLPQDAVELAVAVSARFAHAHGPPVRVGDPERLGIADLGRPDFGDPVALRPGDVPVFWACGVTAQLAARAARPPRLLTHAPGHMFVTDRSDAEAAARMRVEWASARHKTPSA